MFVTGSLILPCYTVSEYSLPHVIMKHENKHCDKEALQNSLHRGLSTEDLRVVYAYAFLKINK